MPVAAALILLLLLQDSPVRKNVTRVSTTAVQAIAPDLTGTSLTRFVPDDVSFVIGLKPASFLTNERVSLIVDHAKARDLLNRAIVDLNDATGLNVAAVEEVLLFADRGEVDRINHVRHRLDTRQRLKLVALGMHSFSDTYRWFPGHSGLPGISQGNLSWRVLLLPMMGYSDLYEQFDLDAPWDAPQNKRLISQMPREFVSDGVTEAGKTSLHLPGGLNAPFASDTPATYRTVMNQSGNTVMLIQAGPDKAEYWTKPGALEIDSSDPIRSLGNVGDEFCIAMADASARHVESSIEPEILNSVIQQHDELPVPWSDDEHQGRNNSYEWPAVLIKTKKPIDQVALIKALRSNFGPSMLKHGNRGQIHQFGGLILSFPKPDIMILSSSEMHSRFDVRNSPPRKNSALAKFSSMYGPNEFALLISAEAATSAGRFAFASRRLGELGTGMKGAAAVFSSGQSEMLATVDIETADRIGALQMQSMIKGIATVGCAMLLESLRKGDPSATLNAAESASQFFDRVQVNAVGNFVSVRVSLPGKDISFLEAMAPSVRNALETHLEARRAKRQKDEDRQLEQLRFAAGQYLDEHTQLPRASSFSNGLSWRVALLPQLGFKDLYEKFHLNEPWDSPRNRELIPLMPGVFQSREVAASGHTTLHVFDVEGAPFSSHIPGTERETLSSNGVGLFFRSSPSRADIWTKPGGLEFSPERPAASLGEPGEQFSFLTMTGRVRRLSGSVDAETMEKLIFLTSQSKSSNADFEATFDFAR